MLGIAALFGAVCLYVIVHRKVPQPVAMMTTEIYPWLGAPLAPPATTSNRRLDLRSPEQKILDAAPKADVHFHPFSAGGPTHFVQGTQMIVRLEIGRSELLEEIDKVNSEFEADKRRGIPMTASLKPYLTCDTSIECLPVGSDIGETFPGFTVWKWLLTPKSSGDHMLAWRLYAVLPGKREVAIADGQDIIQVEYSWRYSIRQWWDGNVIGAIEGLLLVALGAALKAGWDSLQNRRKPTQKAAP